MVNTTGRVRTGFVARLTARLRALVGPVPAPSPAEPDPQPVWQPDPVAPGAALLPCDVWPTDHVPHAVRTNYRSERTGKVTYRFNSAGYLGEEFNPAADLRICLVGESHAAGLAVPHHQSFGHRFKTHVAAALDMAPNRVNLVNLACTAASPDYIVRTLARQIDIIRPHLVLAVMPSTDRIELYYGEQIRNFSASGVAVDLIPQSPIEFQGFVEFYTADWGKMNAARNAVLLQSLAQRHRAEHLILTHMLRPGAYDTPLLQTYFQHLDPLRIVQRPAFCGHADFGADGTHFGPRTHEALAITLLAHYGLALENRGDMVRSARVVAFADRLKTQSTDWAFVQESVSAIKDGGHQ
jgi:hypothetical protein